MKRINFSFVFPLLALVILVFALSHQLFSVPPLGKVLNPFVGVVQNEKEAVPDMQILPGNMGLKDTVNIYFDDRKVPHVYASDAEDLYFAQGYITAAFRLWQMDFVSYASAGRLAEVMGAEYVDYDRNQRRIGMLSSAKSSLLMIEKDPETSKVLNAYTKGVNAWIDRLNYRNMPVEYKLLDYRPEHWTNLKTVLIMKYMANMLSGYEEDVNMSNMMVALGEMEFNKLFPDFQDHITPVAGDTVRPLNPSLTYVRRPEYLNFSFLSSGSVIADDTYNPKLGSNSWVVSGKKTRSGYPILCTDPHLNLSLPAIWFEMQMTAPGLNVYGVSIPGTPALIIGFNENIAWGITNGADDVKDWYKLKITSDYKKYELDSKWLPLGYTVEPVKIKGQQTLYDTVYKTIHGPVVFDRQFKKDHPELVNYALKWELHNPSNEFLTFIKLNRASNYNEYKDAIKGFACPAQNFTFACKNNDIAVTHQGSIPVKWPGQGKFLLDGTTSAALYTRHIPTDSLPQALNPACNYVVSANQHPTYANYPYYYNGYFSVTRANRIKEMLENENSFDIQKMEAMQLDNRNALAVRAMPVLIKSLHSAPLNKEQEQLLAALSAWKGDYGQHDEYARLFELLWMNIRHFTWDEFKEYSFYTRFPDD